MSADHVPAEQLVYAWTRHGVTGAEGFQVRARSEGFDGQDQMLLDAALKLCEYSASTQSEPTAFGWSQFRTTRLWFRRGPDAPDTRGRRGTFCTHIYASQRDRVSVRRVLSLLRTGPWIAAERDAGPSFDLPLVEMRVSSEALAPPEAGSSPERAAALLSSLVTAWRENRRLAVLAESDDLIRAYEHVVSSAPEIFEDRSFVSYLHPRARVQFHLAGVSEPTAAPPNALLVELGEFAGSASVRDLAERIIAGDTTSDLAVAVDMGARSDTFAFDALAESYETTQRVRAAAQLSHADVLRLLAKPAAAQLAFADERARNRISSELAEGDKAVWAALREVAPSVDSRSRESLGAKIYAMCDVRHLDVAHAYARVADPLVTRGLALAAIADATNDPSALERLPVELIIDMLGIESGASWREGALRRCRDKPRSILDRADVDLDDRGEVAADSLLEGREGSLATRISADPRLVTAGARRANQRGMLVDYATLVADGSEDRARTLLACWVPRADSEDLVALAVKVVAASRTDPLGAAVDCVSRLASRTSPIRWNPLADITGEAAALHLLQPTRRALTLPNRATAAFGRMAGAPTAESWSAILATASYADTVTDIRQRLVSVRMLPTRRQQFAAKELLLDGVLQRARHPETVVQSHQILFGEETPPDEACKRVLIASQREDWGRPTSSRVALLSGAILFASGRRSLLARAPSDEVLDLCTESLRRMTGRDLEQLAQELEKVGGSRWLRQLLEREVQNDGYRGWAR